MLRDYERAWTAAEGLVTDRPGCVMRGADGTLVEVFEWSSAEAGQMFGEFEPVAF